MPTGRSSPLPYTPAPPPDLGRELDPLSRATWDELYRIAQRLFEADRPYSLSVFVPQSAGETINVGTGSPAFSRLFDLGASIAWEEPPGTFDGSTGTWTCPTEGLWQILATITVLPFPAPGDREYTVELLATITPAGGGPVITRNIFNGAQDTQYVATTLPIMIPMFKGDTLVLDARAVLSLGVGGTAPVSCRLQLHRLSGVR